MIKIYVLQTQKMNIDFNKAKIFYMFYWYQKYAIYFIYADLLICTFCLITCKHYIYYLHIWRCFTFFYIEGML